jgi:NAD-dependent DNA ligase
VSAQFGDYSHAHRTTLHYYLQGIMVKYASISNSPGPTRHASHASHAVAIKFAFQFQHCRTDLA